MGGCPCGPGDGGGGGCPWGPGDCDKRGGCPCGPGDCDKGGGCLAGPGDCDKGLAGHHQYLCFRTVVWPIPPLVIKNPSSYSSTSAHSCSFSISLV